jgi:hypothetical protein
MRNVLSFTQYSSEMRGVARAEGGTDQNWPRLRPSSADDGWDKTGRGHQTRSNLGPVPYAESHYRFSDGVKFCRSVTLSAGQTSSHLKSCDSILKMRKS